MYLGEFKKQNEAQWTGIRPPPCSTKFRSAASASGVIRSTFVVEADGTLSFARYNVRAKGHVNMVAGLLDVDLSEQPGE